MSGQNMLDFGVTLAPSPLEGRPELQLSRQSPADGLPGHGRHVATCKRCGRTVRKVRPDSKFCTDLCGRAWRHEKRGRIEEGKKKRAMRGSAALNAGYLAIAREAARRIRLRDGTADADRVHLLLESEGTVLPSGWWWGSLFKCDPDYVWTRTGDWVKSKHKGSKNRETRVWK